MSDMFRIQVNVMVYKSGMAYGSYPMFIERDNILAVMPLDVHEHEVGAMIQLKHGVTTPFADSTRNNHISVLESYDEVCNLIEGFHATTPRVDGRATVHTVAPLTPNFDSLV